MSRSTPKESHRYELSSQRQISIPQTGSSMTEEEYTLACTRAQATRVRGQQVYHSQEANTEKNKFHQTTARRCLRGRAGHVHGVAFTIGGRAEAKDARRVGCGRELHKQRD